MSTTAYYRPNGAGVASTWTIGGSVPPVNPFEAVDESAANDDVDYLYRNDSQGSHTFTLEPRAIPTSSTIIRVFWVFRAIRTSTPVNAAARYVIDGSQGSAHSFAVQSSWTTHSWDQTVHPITLIAWTPEQINGTESSNNITGIGVTVSGIVAGEGIRVTQLYMGVEYNPYVPPVASTAAVKANVFRRRRMAAR